MCLYLRYVWRIPSHTQHTHTAYPTHRIPAAARTAYTHSAWNCQRKVPCIHVSVSLPVPVPVRMFIIMCASLASCFELCRRMGVEHGCPSSPLLPPRYHDPLLMLPVESDDAWLGSAHIALSLFGRRTASGKDSARRNFALKLSKHVVQAVFYATPPLLPHNILLIVPGQSWSHKLDSKYHGAREKKELWEL